MDSSSSTGITYNQWITDVCPKQKLLNFLEIRDKVVFEIYETDYFFTAVIIMAPEFAIRSLVIDLPNGIMCHINATTQKFEVFVEKR